MRIMKQTRTHGGQVFPFPRPDEIVLESPPSFLWLREADIKQYKIEIRDEYGTTVWSAETSLNAAVPDIILPPGSYNWNVYGGDLERGWQAFTIAENAVRFPRPKAEEVLGGLPDERPRHLFCTHDIAVLRETHKAELETLRRNVRLALESPLPQPPDFHLNGDMLKYREYFGKHRDVCDRDLVALTLASVLLDDDEAGEYAKKLILTLCSWNPDGPCSPDWIWGDEIGLSHSRCFPAVYDLLWKRLSDNEKIFIGRTIAAYASACERRLVRLDFLQNPGDSHSGRLPAYLGEAALVLAGTGIVPEDILKRWLSYALEIYGGIFPHFGGSDGGWAEGTFYASSYTKWYLPFFSAVARFSGKNFLDRPFYQNLIHFFLHFSPPGWENHPFCDGYWCLPDDAEWPGFFAQNPFRIYAGRGNAENSAAKLARRFSEQLKSPDIFKLHLLDIFLPDMPPPDNCLTGEIQNARAFPDSGFISLHTDILNPERDIALLARASRFGRVSHQHADQGGFALIRRGRALISPSGYFGSAFGTKHHEKWTRTTFAHNCILIDGDPQPEDFTSTGKIISCGQENGTLYAELELSAAYPMLKAYTRSFTLEEKDGAAVLIVRDKIKADRPVKASFLNHTLSKPSILPDGCATVSRGESFTKIEPVSGLLPVPEMTDSFTVGINDGVPPEHWVDAPSQYHLRWESESASEHDISMKYIITDA